jgi:transcriptional regulator with XRE-family HTH domain
METIAIVSAVKDKQQNLAENLYALLKTNDLNANQLAQILGIPMMTIRRLLSGETTDPRISTLKLIADYFGVSIDSLIEKGNLAASSNFGKARPLFVPKLNWETVSKISSLGEINLATWKEWQSVSLGEKEKISPNAFALESRPSMFPRFPQGTLFIFDSEATPKDGDIVLIKLKKNNELTLRELVIDPPEWQLHPIVAGSNILHYSENEHKITGINILTMLFNRKDYC